MLSRLISNNCLILNNCRTRLLSVEPILQTNTKLYSTDNIHDNKFNSSKTFSYSTDPATKANLTDHKKQKPTDTKKWYNLFGNIVIVGAVVGTTYGYYSLYKSNSNTCTDDKRERARLDAENAIKKELQAELYSRRFGPKLQNYINELEIMSKNNSQTEEYCLEAVKYNGELLQYVDNVTLRIYKVARQFEKIVTESGYENSYYVNKGRIVNLTYVKKQTPTICMYAVNEDSSMLQYVVDQTPEMCIVAIKKDITTRKYIKKFTEDIYIEMIKIDPMLLAEIPSDQLTEKLCDLAISLHVCAIQFVPHQMQTEIMCNDAIKQYDYLKNYVDKTKLDDQSMLNIPAKQSLCLEHYKCKTQ
jgi:hypothetical protein